MKRSPRTDSASHRTTRKQSAAPLGPVGSAASVRWSRIKNARARIAAEYYDRGDVRDRLVSALLTELKQG